MRDSVLAGAHELNVPLSVAAVCVAAAARLPITGAAVSVCSDLTASELVCATGALSRVLEELQLTLGEGPSLEVLAGGRAILIGDLESPQPQARWPMFAAQAVEMGGRGFFAFPMRAGAVRGGVLTLCSRRPGSLPAEGVAEAWVFAEMALELLLDAQAGINGQEGHMPVDGLVGGRPEVHQATGMISVQLGVGMIEALARLRALAFAEDRPLSQVASDVVSRRVRFETEDSA